MYFSEQALADMRAQFQSVPEKHAHLQQRYLERNYRENRAKEFAHHGYLRRLRTLGRCIENVFEILPPEQVAVPERDARHDAEINIQASVFNAFAAADNLAWIWVVEKDVKRPDGSALPDTWVGLRQGNTAVRNSMPQALRDYLVSLDPWFEALDNFRHALAHRIPLYIPPYVILAANEQAYRDLETRRMQALTGGNLEEYERLSTEQKALEIFRPWMMHSFHEEAQPMVFHPQLLANFNTIEELGRKVLEALDA